MSEVADKGKDVRVLLEHPVQLVGISVAHLMISVRQAVTPDYRIDAREVRIAATDATMLEGKNIFTLSVRASYRAPGFSLPMDNSGSDDSCVSFLVEMTGEYEFNREVMSEEDIVRFTKQGALHLMLPFVRDQVYSLTMRAGIKPVMIPTYQIPIFYVKQN